MKLKCSIQLPASKSESNRALMIAAYGGFAPDFQNLSDSEDTMVLSEALQKIQNSESIIDIADCGTAARFLTTYLACHEGRWLLTGSRRMKQRPIKPLVDTLMVLGANIQYVEKQGFLPLQIQGKPIQGGKVGIEMTQSSQFVSSLLLAAPKFSQGIELELLGGLSSLSYLDMTLAMMQHFGAEAERCGRTVVVKSKAYEKREFVVSSDWSAASYWYEMAALSEDCEITLRPLSLLKSRQSLQGDSIIAEWMESLGVKTVMNGDDLVLTKTPIEKRHLSFDFSNAPDLFPTIVATCAGLQLEAHFTGIANLHIKESDRVEAMRIELDKIGSKLEYVSENELVLQPSVNLPYFERSNPLRFSVHDDHRIVMALAPLSMKVGHFTFDHPEVVKKSYPSYWEDASFLLVI